MKKLMQYLFLSCLKASQLIEKKIYSRLSFKEQLQLKMHKAMCEACTNYEKDSLLIDKALQQQTTQPPVITGIDLEAFEKSLANKLEQKRKK